MVFAEEVEEGFLRTPSLDMTAEMPTTAETSRNGFSLTQVRRCQKRSFPEHVACLDHAIEGAIRLLGASVRFSLTRVDDSSSARIDRDRQTQSD